jgi:nifR3 family TIM-barrel protein
MIFKNFWNEIPRPMIGLSPMDGVTDPCFRRIVARSAKPDFIMTEFTSVDGICHGAESELSGLLFDESERPVIAQIYGAEPDFFFQVAQLICDLGFDGIDINMGCPAKKVSSRGCGAGLIKDPPRAKAILQAVRQGISAWADGASRSLSDFHPKVGDWFRSRPTLLNRAPFERKIIPVSLKTRLGTDQVVIAEWVKHLLDASPSAISIHGRTLAQGYRGEANWDAISEAVQVAEGSGTLIIGNGDLMSLDDAFARIRQSGVDGALIGRAALGNPWLFQNKERFRAAFNRLEKRERHRKIEEPSIALSQRLHTALEHARLFEAMHGISRFSGMRKHLGWYCRGFQGAGALRAKIVRVRNADEVETLLAPFFQGADLRSEISELSRI